MLSSLFTLVDGCFRFVYCLHILFDILNTTTENIIDYNCAWKLPKKDFDFPNVI